jgi:hypothetical protein
MKKVAPDPIDYDKAWADQRKRRSEAAKGNKGRANITPFKKGRGGPSGDASPLSVYSEAACTQARAMLQANLRSNRRGLSWKAIGDVCGIPYSTVHKLSRPLLSDGRRYRKDSEPTETMIQHWQDMLEEKYKEDYRSKIMIQNDKRAIDLEVEAASSMAQAEVITRETDEVIWFNTLCRDNGLIIPRKPSELNWTLGQILALDIAELDKARLSKAFNQVMARLENMKVNSPDWNHTYPDSRKRIPQIN